MSIISSVTIIFFFFFFTFSPANRIVFTKATSNNVSVVCDFRFRTRVLRTSGLVNEAVFSPSLFSSSNEFFFFFFPHPPIWVRVRETDVLHTMHTMSLRMITLWRYTWSSRIQRRTDTGFCPSSTISVRLEPALLLGAQENARRNLFATKPPGQRPYTNPVCKFRISPHSSKFGYLCWQTKKIYNAIICVEKKNNNNTLLA